ncbi:MAG: hypothetical protein ACFFB8_12605 [Promethearchaeota archaeon]
MEVNEMQKYNIAHKIQTSFDFTSLIVKLDNLDIDPNIKHVKYVLSPDNNPEFLPILEKFQIAIIDFEGSPVFLFGIGIDDTIMTYYIESYHHKTKFILAIFSLLNLIKDLTLFSFSDHERLELLKMHAYLKTQDCDVSAFEFISSLPIINLQDTHSRFESLQEAIYSINIASVRLTGDALLRNNKLIDRLFAAKKFKEIIAHNRNCLLNESILFQKRWYRNYKL